jgi:hypothetical protein
MSLMMPDSGVIDPDLMFAALLVAPVTVPVVEYAVAVPFADWFGPNQLVLGVTTDGSAAEAQALQYTGGVLVQRAGDDEAWTEVAR